MISEKTYQTKTKKELIALLSDMQEKIASMEKTDKAPISKDVADNIRSLLSENDRLKKEISSRRGHDAMVGIENLTDARQYLPCPESNMAIDPDDKREGIMLNGTTRRTTIIPDYWLLYYISVDLPCFRDGEVRVNNRIVRQVNPSYRVADIDLPDHWMEFVKTMGEIREDLNGDKKKLFAALDRVNNKSFIDRYLAEAEKMLDELQNKKDAPESDISAAGLLVDELSSYIQKRFYPKEEEYDLEKQLKDIRGMIPY